MRSKERSPRPDFPDEWRSAPNVMFSAGHAEFEPFRWGQPNWVTEQAYDADLATFLGDLACASDVPEAQTRSLARRALATPAFEPERVWPPLFAKQVTGPDCPPAKALPEDTRRQLEQLAGRDDAAVAPPQTSLPASVE